MKKIFLILLGVTAVILLTSCNKDQSMDYTIKTAVERIEKKLPAGSNIAVGEISCESAELSESVANELASVLAESGKLNLVDGNAQFDVSGSLEKVRKSNYYIIKINAVDTQSGSAKVNFKAYNTENGVTPTFGDKFSLNWRLYSIPALILIGCFIAAFYLSILIGLMTKSNAVCLIVRFILYGIAGVIVHKFSMASGWEYVLVVILALTTVNHILTKNQNQKKTT